MTRKRLSETTVKKIFALSGNRCAFPNCHQSIVEDDMLIGQICHIEAANEGGERYNQQQSDEERCAIENLILLCANHHLVTNDVKKYPVAVMQQMKRDNELRSANNPFDVSNRIITEALNAEIHCGPLSLNTASANIHIIHDPVTGQFSNVEPDFNRIHLGNQFLPPFVILTLNFRLPLINTGALIARDWAVHIRAPHMSIKSTDEKFSKNVPADNEIMLHSNTPIFPKQETTLSFSLGVRVHYELEAENKFRKLLFNPLGVGIVDALPITLTMYSESSNAKTFSYVIQSEVYLSRLNNYFKRKHERDVRPIAERRQTYPTQRLLQNVDKSDALSTYLLVHGREDAQHEISVLFNRFAQNISELGNQARTPDVEVGGIKHQLVARRKGIGACSVEMNWQGRSLNRSDEAGLTVSFWEGLLCIPGSSEIILEPLMNDGPRMTSSQVWKLKCRNPKCWNWENGISQNSYNSAELANHLYECFADLIKEHHPV